MKKDKKPCSARGCHRPAVARGLCNAHHKRLLAGKPVDGPIMVMARGALPLRLQAHLKVDKKTGCHQWMGYRTNDGYGRIGVGDKKRPVHRVAWEAANGPIPEGMLVMHTCDNRRCCNPDHLKLGTHADNAADQKSKGRGNGCWKRDFKKHPQWR